MADILSRKEFSLSPASLVALQAGGSRSPIYFVHACDGEVLFLTDLARHLGSEQPFYGLRAQGLDKNTAPYTRVEDMATHYLREIQAVQTEGPYFIGGAGVGGIVALEMAQQLISQRKNVGMLVLADTPLHAPLRKEVLSRMAFYLKREGGRYLVRFGENFVHLLYRRMAEIVYPRYRREDKVSEYAQRAADRYTPRTYPDRIVLFMPQKRLGFPDPLARIEQWQRFAPGRLDAHVIPGEHLRMFKEPGVLLMAQYLRAYLEQGSARRGAIAPPNQQTE